MITYGLRKGLNKRATKRIEAMPIIIFIIILPSKKPVNCLASLSKPVNAIAYAVVVVTWTKKTALIIGIHGHSTPAMDDNINTRTTRRMAPAKE